MHFDPPPPEPYDTKLAGVLDRLAGVLEQQASRLDALTSDVRSLIGILKQVDTRLAALEQRPATTPAATPAESHVVTPPTTAGPRPAPAKSAGKKPKR